MSNVSKPNTFSPNTTALSSEVNENFDTIYNEFNGNIDASNLTSDAVTTSKIADEAVTTAKLADTSVNNAKLATGAGEPGNYTSWTPTLSGRFTDADWTKNCRYTQVGKKVSFVFDITATDATPMAGGTGEATFTLPVTAASSINLTNNLVLGIGRILDSGTAVFGAQIEITSTTQARIRVLNTSSTYLGSTTITSTVPMTWTTNDAITIEGFYEAA